MTAPLVIYCDASVDAPEKGGAAGWGAVFVRNREVIAEASGELSPMDSCVAEFKAVRLSLEHALRNKLARKGSTVIVASDCDAVEQYLEPSSRKYRRRRADLREIAEAIGRVAAKAELELVVSWMKGHRPDTPVHGPHNARADRLSKKASGVAARQGKLRAERRVRARERRKKEKAANLTPTPDRETKAARVLSVAAQLEGRS